MSTNQNVKTPLGGGVVQGKMMADDGRWKVIVRMPINDVTKATMKQAFCLTPRATVSGLWVFAEGEIK